MKTLVIVDDPSQCPIQIPGIEVHSAQQYLMDEQYKKLRGAKVFNLCRSYRYQTLGYYVSLLASARGHKPLPSTQTIQDLKSHTLVKMLSEDIDELIQKNLADIKSEAFTLSIYFGHNTARKYDRLSNQLFKLFQAPLLRAEFKKTTQWKLDSIKALSAIEIPESHLPLVNEFAKQFFRTKKSFKKETSYCYDLAILTDDTEPLPPSDSRAIKKFIRAAHKLGLNAEVIHKDDIDRIAEFDALFVRATTAVNHPTYRIARRAKAEGLVVIDDPDSILKCTNKIYLSELFESHRIRSPKTMVVHRENFHLVERVIGFPCILKRPDSAFSQGVKKACNAEELLTLLEAFWATSALIIAQQYLPTEFDWRIGILDNKPLYACKYFMAPDHWQIIKPNANGKSTDGRVRAFNLDDVPDFVIKTAVRAANLIGNSFYGVDLKESGGKSFVMEINDNPNVDVGYEDTILKDELYNTIMQVFRDRIQRQKQWHH